MATTEYSTQSNEIPKRIEKETTETILLVRRIYEILLKSNFLFFIFSILSLLIRLIVGTVQFLVLFIWSISKVLRNGTETVRGFVQNVGNFLVDLLGSEKRGNLFVRMLRFVIGNTTKKTTKDGKTAFKVQDLVLDKGYPLEEYTVKTKDGYFLKLFRIPYSRKEKEEKELRLQQSKQSQSPGQETEQGKQRPVVFFLHGLMSSSSFFLIGDTIAYKLSDLGYDCWFGNTRGNEYSNTHETLSIEQPEFWDHTFNEYIDHDFPTMINFVLKKTKQDTFSYYGFSQGTSQGFAGFSVYPELSQKCKLFVAFAPTANLKFLYSFFMKIVSALPSRYTQKVLGKGAIFQKMVPRVKQITGVNFFSHLIEGSMTFLFGWHNRMLNKQWMPQYAQTLYSPMATKNILYWFQQLRNQSFDRFDYEDEKINLKKYGQVKPPQYNLKKITCPMALYSGAADSLSNLDFVTKNVLNPKLLVDDLRLPDYEHLDSVWGINLDKLIFPRVLKLMEKYHPLPSLKIINN
ncbi:sterol esterase tgl1 [Anaeramoeba flamelloides]|uniref:Sterol esterase tgl1 n=1 Tax=Anaeramoeba flamelloides TaxID=1746091 RepID=A0ABQ8YXB2_9EUKA|nr:sterol esterase tgl1 [Anaeramoeba flamelloides]